MALRDFDKLVMRLEKTYDGKEHENQPRLAAAYWGAELIVRMPQSIWPHDELRFTLGALRNFGYLSIYKATQSPWFDHNLSCPRRTKHTSRLHCSRVKHLSKDRVS